MNIQLNNDDRKESRTANSRFAKTGFRVSLT